MDAEFGKAVFQVGGRVVIGAPNDVYLGRHMGAAYTYSSSPLDFRWQPPVVQSGTTIDVDVCQGDPTAPVFMFVVGINGAPSFLPVVGGLFDATGGWYLDGTILSGPGVVDLDFQCFSIGIGGNLVKSNVSRYRSADFVPDAVAFFIRTVHFDLDLDLRAERRKQGGDSIGKRPGRKAEPA